MTSSPESFLISRFMNCASAAGGMTGMQGPERRPVAHGGGDEKGEGW